MLDGRLGALPQDRLYISVYGWPSFKHFNKTVLYFAAPGFVGPVWLPSDHVLLPLIIRPCAHIRVSVNCVGYDRGVTRSARVSRSIELSHVDRIIAAINFECDFARDVLSASLPISAFGNGCAGR